MHITGKIKGVIKDIKPNGYGFISGDDGKQYFFNYLDLEMKWDKFYKEFNGIEVRVEFIPTNTPKGPRANELELLDL